MRDGWREGWRNGGMMGRWWVGGEKQGGRRLSQTPPRPRSLSSLPRSRSMKSAAPPSMAALPGRALPLRPVLPPASPRAPCVSCSAHHHCPCIYSEKILRHCLPASLPDPGAWLPVLTNPSHTCLSWMVPINSSFINIYVNLLPPRLH